nr:MAG TPA: hypothetical protein [Caudoviricetes sp.]
MTGHHIALAHYHTSYITCSVDASYNWSDHFHRKIVDKKNEIC